MRLLISAGANVNAAFRLDPPLVYAAERGDVDSIHALIEAGAKVNRRLPGGATAFMEAAESGNLAAVEALLSAGAEANAKDSSGKDALNYTRWLPAISGASVEHATP